MKVLLAVIGRGIFYILKQLETFTHVTTTNQLE